MTKAKTIAVQKSGAEYAGSALVGHAPPFLGAEYRSTNAAEPGLHSEVDCLSRRLPAMTAAQR